VSCAGSAGNCSAAGIYTDSSGYFQAFVVNETNGSWGNAEEAPGTATLNTGGSASVPALSCPSAGDCAATGSYKDSSRQYEAFVVNEKDGTWGRAEEIPGTAKLNVGGYAMAPALSCASAGNCAAGGYYEDSSGHEQAFVVNEMK
jgi:hypothetical protein